MKKYQRMHLIFIRQYIKQTLSDFEIRDLKMVDTDIEDIIRRFYRKEL